jgi:hypothetical protein
LSSWGPIARPSKSSRLAPKSRGVELTNYCSALRRKFSGAGLNRNEDPKEERGMDIKAFLSTPMGMGIAVIAGLILLIAAWKINKIAIKVLFIVILAAIAAAVFFFRKGGF